MHPKLSIKNSYSDILQVLQKDQQAHLNDKPSDNIPDNVNCNVNSVEDIISNDIHVPTDCEHGHS